MSIKTSTNFTVLPDEESLIIPSLYKGEGFVSQGLFEVSDQGMLNTFSVKNGEAYSPVLDKNFLKAMNKRIDRRKLAGLNGGKIIATDRLKKINNDINTIKNSDVSIEKHIKKFSAAKKKFNQYKSENIMLSAASKGNMPKENANDLIRKEAIANMSAVDGFVSRYTKTLLEKEALIRKANEPGLSEEAKKELVGKLSQISHDAINMKPGENLLSVDRIEHMPNGATDRASSDIKETILAAVNQRLKLGHSDEEILEGLTSDTEFKNSITEIAKSKLDISDFRSYEFGDSKYDLKFKEKNFFDDNSEESTFIQKTISEYEQKITRGGDAHDEAIRETKRIEGKIKREKEALKSGSAMMPSERIKEEMQKIDDKYSPELNKLGRVISSYENTASILEDINSGNPSESTIDAITNSYKTSYISKLSREKNEIISNQQNGNMDAAYSELTSAINGVMSEQKLKEPTYATYKNGSAASNAMLEIDDKDARALYQALYQEGADGTYSNQKYLTTFPIQNDDGSMTKLAINDIEEFDKTLAKTYLSEVSSDEIIGNEHNYLNHTVDGEKVSTPIDTLYKKANDYRKRISKLDESGKAILYSEAAREYSKAPIDIKRASEGGEIPSVPPRAPHGKRIELTDREISLLGGEEAAKKITGVASIFEPEEKIFGDNRYTAPRAVGENVRFIDNVLEPMMNGDNRTLRNKATELQSRFNAVARIENSIAEGNYAKIGAAIDSSSEGTFSRVYKGILQHTNIDNDTKFGALPLELQIEVADRMHKGMVKDIDYGINGLITTAYSQKFDVEKLKTKKQLLEHKRTFFESQVEYVDMYERGNANGDSGIMKDSIGVFSDDEANNAKKAMEIEKELAATADAIKAQGISISEADRKIVDRIGKKDFEGLKLIVGDSYETLNIKKLGRELTIDELNTGIVSYNKVDMAIENFDAYHQLMSIDSIRGGKVGALSFTNEEWESGVVSFDGTSFKTSQFYEYYNMDNRVAQVEYSDTVRKQGLRNIANVNADIQDAVANATQDITYNKRTTVKGEIVEKSKYVSKDNSKVPINAKLQSNKNGDGLTFFFNQFELDGEFGVDKVNSGDKVLSFPEAPAKGFTDKIIKERKFTKTEEVAVGQVPLFLEDGPLSKQMPLSKRTKTKATEFLKEVEQVDPLNMIIGHSESGEAIRGAITIDNYKEVADIYGVDRSKIEEIVRLSSLESQTIKRRDNARDPRRKETAKDLDRETINYLEKKFGVNDLSEVTKPEQVREIDAHLERLRKKDVAERAAITGSDYLEFEKHKEFEGMVAGSNGDTVKMAVKKEPDIKMTALFVDAMKDNEELVIDSDAVNYTVDGVQDGMVKLTANHVAIDDVKFGFKYNGDGSLVEQFFKLDDALYERGRDTSAEIKNAKIASMDLDKVAFDAMIDGESKPISKRTLLEWMQDDTVMENGRRTSRIGSQLSKEQFTWITNSGERLRDINGTTYLAIAQTLDSMEETGFIKILEEANITPKELAEGISKKEVVEALSNGMAHNVKVNMLIGTVNPNGDASNALDTAMRVATAYVKNDGKEVTPDNLADALSHMKNGLGVSSDEMKQYFSTINDVTYDQILEYQKRNPDTGGLDTLLEATDMPTGTVSSKQRRLDNWSQYKAELADHESYLDGLSKTHADILTGLKNKMKNEAAEESKVMTGVLNKNDMLENRIIKTSNKLNNIRKSQFETHNGSIAREEVGQALEMIFGNVESQSHLNVNLRNTIKDSLTPAEDGSVALVDYIMSKSGDTPTISSKRLAQLVTSHTSRKLSVDIADKKYTPEAAIKMRFDALQQLYDKEGLKPTMDFIKESGNGDFVTGLTDILGDKGHTFKTIDEALTAFTVGDLPTLEQYTFLTKYIGGLELTGTFERDGKDEIITFGDYKSLNKKVSPIGVTGDGEKIRVVQDEADATMTRSIASFRSGQVNKAKKNVTKGQYSGSINTDDGLALMTSTKFSYKNASSRPYGGIAKVDPITSITNLNKAVNAGATVGTWDFETTGLPDKLNRDVFKPVEFSFTPGRFNNEGRLVQNGENVTKYLAPPKAVEWQFEIAQLMAEDGEFDSLFTKNTGLSKIGGDSAMYGLLHNYAKYDNTSINIGGTETTVGKLLGSKMQSKDGIVFADIDGSTINTGKSVSDVVEILSQSSRGVVNHLLNGTEMKYGIDPSQVFHNEKEFVQFAHSTLKGVDYNSGHNISGFDLPALERWMVDNGISENAKEIFDKSIDTQTLAIMQNPGRNSNSQEHLTRNLDIPKSGMAHLASYDVEANMALLNDIVSSENIKTMMADSTEIIKPTDYIYNKRDAKIGLQGLGTGVFQILGLEDNKLTVRSVLDDTVEEVDSIKQIDIPNVASLKKAAADGWINFGDNKELAEHTFNTHARQDAGRTLDNAIGNGMWDRYLQYGDKSSLETSKEVLNDLKGVYEKKIDIIASQFAKGRAVERFTTPVLKDIEAIATANASKLSGSGYTDEINLLENIAKKRTKELKMFKDYSLTDEGKMIKDYANAARIRKDANIYDKKTYEGFTSGLSTLIGDFKTQAVKDGKLSKDALMSVPDIITLGTMDGSTFDSPLYKGSGRLKGLKDFEFNINMTSAESIEDSILKASGRLGNHMLSMHSVASKEQGAAVALNSFILPYLNEKGMVSDPNLKDAIAKAAINSNSNTYSDYKNAALILASDMMSKKEAIIDKAEPLQVIDKIFAIEDEELLGELDKQVAELMRNTDASAMSVNRYEIDEATGKHIIKESVLPENAHEAIERVVNSIATNEKQHIENLSLLAGKDIGYNPLPGLNLSPVTNNSDLDEVIRRMAPDAEYMHDANNPWMQWKKANDLKDVAVNLDTGMNIEEFKNARRHVVNSMSQGKMDDAIRHRNSMSEVFDIVEKALGTSMLDESYIEKLNQDTVANSHAAKYINSNSPRWSKNKYDKTDILKHLARRADMIDEAAPISGHISDEVMNNNRTKYEAMKAIGMLQQDNDGKWFTGSIGFGEGMLDPNKVIMTTNVGQNIGKPMSTLPIEVLESLAADENVPKGQKSAVSGYLNTLSKQDGLSNGFRRNYNADAEQRLVDYLGSQTNKYSSLEEAVPSAVERLNKEVKEKGKEAASKNSSSTSTKDVKKMIKASMFEPEQTSITDSVNYQRIKQGIKTVSEGMKGFGESVFSSGGAKLGAAALAFAGALALTRQFTSDGGQRNADGSAIDNQARIVEGDLQKEYNGINRSPFNPQKTVRLEGEGEGLNISARARNNGSANNVNIDNVLKDSIGSSLSANVNIRHSDDRSTINQEYVQGLFSNALK